VQPGWKCLDLGAGLGTVSRWLNNRVGPAGQVVALDREPRHIEPADGLSVRWTDASGPPITMPLSSLPAAIVPCGVAGLVKAVRSTRPAIRSGPGRHRRPGLVQDRGGGGLKAACGDRAGYFTEPAVNPFWICRWKIT
jgi:hypothetical protein